MGALTLPAQVTSIVYDDALQNGWSDWSWSSTRDFSNANPVHSGTKSIAVTLTGSYAALSLGNYQPVDMTVYTNLSFWINGGASGGQLLQVFVEAPLGTAHTHVALTALTANTWTHVDVSSTALGVANVATLGRIYLQDRAGVASDPTFYVDDIQFQGIPQAPITNVVAAISVNCWSNRHAISPLVYGTAFATSNPQADVIL